MLRIILIATSLVSYATLLANINLPKKIDNNDQLVVKNGFTISYNESCEQPNWVFYKLKKEDLICDKVERKNRFKADPDVLTESAKLSDYSGSGYDRGHLKPAGDVPCDRQLMDETFYMSNMSPQAASFNRGIWKKLESHVRKAALNSDSLYVITGGVLSDTLKTIGDNGVCVPNIYFKVVYIFNDGNLTITSYMLPNMASKKSLDDFIVTLGAVEGSSGYDFPENF